MKSRSLVALIATVVIILPLLLMSCSDDDGAPKPTDASPTTSRSTGSPTATSTTIDQTPSPEPSEQPLPTDDPSVTLLQLVDKQHALPSGYAPSDLQTVQTGYVAPGYSATVRSAALAALVAMLDGADAAGHDIRVVSGYRSYQEQVTTYQHWVDTLGEEEANRVSARPGHSEHQLGTTVDLGSADFGWDLTEGFGATPSGQWLQQNAADYGFALSYPDGKEAITGYAYEPWHFRYIGVAAAQDLVASGLTLNQFLGA